jgi:hypothetical protein
MNEQLKFLGNIAEKLESCDIPYMLTGSMAMSLYSIPRMTRDIDIVIDPKPHQAETIFRLFKEDCYIDYNSVIQEIERKGMFNIIHNKWIAKADFIIRKDDEFRKVEFEHKRKINIQGIPIFTVAPEDLILTKLKISKEYGSELQFRDAQTISNTITHLDWLYLEKWGKYLGIEEYIKRIHLHE